MAIISDRLGHRGEFPFVFAYCYKGEREEEEEGEGDAKISANINGLLKL